MTVDLDKLIGEQVDVPSLPMVCTQIQATMNDPRSSLADVGRVITQDSGLTARILKLANSAYYGFPSKIDKISRALVIMGTRQLRHFVLCTSVTKLFSGIPKSIVDMESFWQHSVACGLMAQALASYRHETNVERFMVAGLIHDIGRLVLYQNLPEESHKHLTNGGEETRLLHVVEREYLGYDHADVGRVLLRQWKLPPSLIEAVQYHHDPEKTSKYRLEASLIHVADIIIHGMELGRSGEQYVPPVAGGSWDLIGLPTSILAPTIEQVVRQYAELTQAVSEGVDA